MRINRRYAVGLAAVVALLPGAGCNTIATTLGFSPPVHKLIPPAEAIRQANVTPAAAPRELAKSVLAAYVVEPGDSLTVEPAELDSPVRLPGNQTVLIDGTIDLGKYGRPLVAGKTVPQIEADVQKLITAQVKDKEKDAGLITVRLVGRESKVFYVLGEANSPRAYPLAGRETVLDGILVAGGLTRQADPDKIILVRPTPPPGCRVVLPVCYNAIVQLGDTSTNYQLQPGDRIYLPSQSAFDGLPFGPNSKKNKQCGPCTGPQAGCGPGVGCNTGGPAGDVLVPVAMPGQ